MSGVLAAAMSGAAGAAGGAGAIVAGRGWPIWAAGPLAAAALGFLAWLVRRSLRVSRELGDLARVAERIGLGDLATPVPAAGRTATGRLNGAFEVMRRRLNTLTSDLSRQRAEAQAILTGVVEGVFTVDRQRRMRYLNPQAARMLGVGATDVVGRFCGDVLRPEQRGGARPCEENCPILHARFRGGARATEHLTLGAEGRRSVVITSAPMTSDLQVQVMRDESEQEATRRLRDAILANISHEFKTPLSAQLASIELLRDQAPELSGEQAATLILSLQRGTLRLTQLIDNLLESVRIEADEAGIRRRPVDVEDVVEQAAELMRPLLDQRRQELVVELPYPLPAVEGDAPRLVQVFVNLLANANKFAPEGSRVTIGGALAGQELALWVEDQGPGLPEGAGEALFGRFWRAASEEPEPGGAGLGLYIVKSIVERHGGRVGAESSPRGTRMRVVLPVAAAAGQADSR